MHDVRTAAVARGQLVGELSGAVGAVVIHDEQMHIGARVLQPSMDDRQILRSLKVGMITKTLWLGRPVVI